MIVDTSAVLFGVLPHGPGGKTGEHYLDALARIARQERLEAPALLPYEVGAVVFRKHAEILSRRRRSLRSTFLDLVEGIVWTKPTAEEVADAGALARRHRMNAFDAAFVVHAMHRRQALLTADLGMHSHAAALGVPVYLWPDDDSAVRDAYPEPDA